MEITRQNIMVAQNSEEWMELKDGKFSSSMFSDICMGENTKGYQNAIFKVAFERVTGKRQDPFNNQWLDYGHATEPEAAENYYVETFNEVEDAGIWIINEWVMSSPDRKIVGINAGCEFKCPAISTYREYLKQLDKKGKVELPKGYEYQIQGQLLCTGWEYIDYMPYYSSNLRQLLTRVYIDNKIQNELVLRLSDAISDAVNEMDFIKRKI